VCSKDGSSLTETQGTQYTVVVHVLGLREKMNNYKEILRVKQLEGELQWVEFGVTIHLGIVVNLGHLCVVGALC